MSISRSCIALSFVLATTYSCAAPGPSWEETRAHDDVASYRLFIATFPDSPKVPRALKEIEGLDWTTAEETHSVTGYRAFMESYPDSSHASEVESQIEELDWTAAAAEHSVAGYQSFLKSYANSSHASEAKVQIEDLRWLQAGQVDTAEAYNQFLAVYPTSIYKDEIPALLERLARTAGVRSAKSGDLAGVEAFLVSDHAESEELKAQALMMAVWGALHTGIDSGIEGNKLFVRAGPRTATAPRATYVEIIRLLLESGADPARYDYEGFGSQATWDYRQARMMENVAPGQTVSMSGSFGGTPNTNLVIPGEGLSALQVAEIEGADDVLALLNERP